MRLIHLARLRAAAAGQDGFSMLAVLLVMIAASGFIAVGFAAANGDLPVSRNSQDRKVAYAAAESGVNLYQFHLDEDNDYWTKCDHVADPNATEHPRQPALERDRAPTRAGGATIAGLDGAVHDRAAAGRHGDRSASTGDAASMIDPATARCGCA